MAGILQISPAVRMYLLQLLLPAGQTNADTAVLLNQTQSELMARFGGVTAYLQTPAKGQWADATGATTEDRVFLVEVVVAEIDTEWWRSYAHCLAQRFAQDVMHIRVLHVDLIDPASA